jgi:cell division protein FtsQ
VLWGAAAVVTLVVVAGWVLFFSPWVNLRTIEVTGQGRIPASSILTAAGLGERAPLASLDIEGAERRVAELPVVADVRISRNWPHGVTIAVTPRSPVAYVQTPEGPFLVDRAGVKYEAVLDAPPNLPQLEASEGPQLQDAVAVAAAMSPPLQERVSSIVVVDDRIRLTIRGDEQESDGGSADGATDGQTVDGQPAGTSGTSGPVDDSGGLVYWGTAVDSELKASVLAGLLAGGGDYRFFDVATPGYPTAGPAAPEATARLMGLPNDSAQNDSASEPATTGQPSTDATSTD